MENLLTTHELELLNMFFILILGYFTIKSTFQVEYLKSKLDLKTSSEKKHIELQQNSVLFFMLFR